jgi:cytochrome d ubiquinol oxidase subunit I
MEWDALALSRLQFAFTISFHIIFPSFSIGLASYLAVLEGLWLRTGNDKYLRLYDYWVKIFAIAFAMGVVSGVVMSYQFGTNWSAFSQATGNILGPLLGYEVLTAFFLEASFLGIMLFGRHLVGPGLHFIATCIVAFGTLVSAFWILSANSWMHSPDGYELREGVFYATDWTAIIFNPTFPYRLVHMVIAAYLTTAFVVAGIAAILLLKRRAPDESSTMLKMAFGLIVVLAPLQLVAGHEHGLSVYDTQPSKLAAMEGHWETWEGRAPLILFAWPDEANETNLYEVKIPEIGSLIVTGSWDGAITGLKEWPPEDRPNVPLVFWSFRVMVGIGILMILYGLVGAWASWSGLLQRMRALQTLVVPMLPAGFIAVLAGWITAEAGRQPYTVFGLLRTADSVSPIATAQVATSLLIFAAVYAVIFPAGVFYMGRIAVEGPAPGKKGPQPGKRDKPRARKTPAATARRKRTAVRAASTAAPASGETGTASPAPEEPTVALVDQPPVPDEEPSGGADDRDTGRPLLDIAEQYETEELPDNVPDYKREEPENGNT